MNISHVRSQYEGAVDLSHWNWILLAVNLITSRTLIRLKSFSSSVNQSKTYYFPVFIFTI
jgi:hypothetical protein